MPRELDCKDEATRSDAIETAADAVRDGHVVVLPTDTVYGVGADAFNHAAVAALLAAKGRGRDMPPPVLVPNPRTVEGLARDIPESARALMRRFWPGPLTVILKSQESLHWDLGETNGTVAVRVPDDEIALELLERVGPMAVTSANTTGAPAAQTMREALIMLGDHVEVYLDGGPREGGVPSTIIDCTGDAPSTLRLGAIPQEEIDEVLAATTSATTPEAPAPEGTDAVDLAKPSPTEDPFAESAEPETVEVVEVHQTDADTPDGEASGSAGGHTA